MNDNPNNQCMAFNRGLPMVVISIFMASPLFCQGQVKADKPTPQMPAIRFIRLKHSGPGWDDGMGVSKADANFLEHFGKVSGLKTRTKGESIDARLLPKFPADAFPPFLYVTGDDKIGRFSRSDVKAIREFCLKGGMLIADAGSRKFHESFVALMPKLFHGKKLVDIPDDDALYKTPYVFPDGPPAFRAHGGKRPLGIKHEGRWIVFYHPGDMNDAWKSKGQVKASPEEKKAAMQLGMNLLFYAFTQWSEAVAKIRTRKQ